MMLSFHVRYLLFFVRYGSAIVLTLFLLGEARGVRWDLIMDGVRMAISGEVLYCEDIPLDDLWRYPTCFDETQDGGGKPLDVYPDGGPGSSIDG